MLREDDLNWEGHESHGVQIPARAATSWQRRDGRGCASFAEGSGRPLQGSQGDVPLL